jgi:hypothetical protein
VYSQSGFALQCAKVVYERIPQPVQRASSKAIVDLGLQGSYFINLGVATLDSYRGAVRHLYVAACKVGIGFPSKALVRSVEVGNSCFGSREGRGASP